MKLVQPTSPDWLEIVRAKVNSLEYGVVQIIVHGSRVTQIERTEKTRLEAAASTPPRERSYIEEALPDSFPTRPLENSSTQFESTRRTTGAAFLALK